MLLWRRPRDHRPARADRAGPASRPAWVTTTARRCCACSASTSSGRSSSDLPPVDGEEAPAPGALLREADRGGPIPAAVVPGRQLARERSPAAVCSCRSTSARWRRPPGVSAEAGRTARTPIVLADLDARGRLVGAAGRPGHGRAVRRRATTSRRLARGPAGARRGRGARRPAPASGLAARVRGGRAATDGRWPRTRMRLGAWRRPSSRRIGPWWGTRSSRCWSGSCAGATRAAPSSLSSAGGSLPPVAFDTQIAAYILNAALRSQSLADISAERLGQELPRPGELRGPDHAAVQALRRRPPRATRSPTAARRRARAGAHPRRAGAAAHPGPRGPGGDRRGHRPCRPGRAVADLRGGDRPAGGGHLRIGRPPVHARQPQAAGAGAVLRAEPAPRQANQDRLLHRRVRARGAAPGPSRWWACSSTGGMYTKLRSTYVEALPLLLDPVTGRLHTTFQQAVAATGRLSSHRPEPPEHPHPDRARPPHPACVRGRATRTMCCWPPTTPRSSCASWPTCAVTSICEEAFARRADIHRETAARVLKKDAADVTADERSMAKMVNFGLAYGMSDFGLSSHAGPASRATRRRSSSTPTSRRTAASPTT